MVRGTAELTDVIRDAVLLMLPGQNLLSSHDLMSGFHSASTRPSDGEYECTGAAGAAGTAGAAAGAASYEVEPKGIPCSTIYD